MIKETDAKGLLVEIVEKMDELELDKSQWNDRFWGWLSSTAPKDLPGRRNIYLGSMAIILFANRRVRIELNNNLTLLIEIKDDYFTISVLGDENNLYLKEREILETLVDNFNLKLRGK